MLNLCLAPLFLAGYLQTIQTPWHTSADISGLVVEVQTCKDGLGGRMAFSQDMVQVGPQWGISWPINELWSITGSFHGGLGYSNTAHPETGIRQVTKWNGGVSLMIQYDRYSTKIGYDHMSNGKGVDPSNHGQDTISWMVGFTFK
jgi:hypothetical protein